MDKDIFCKMVQGDVPIEKIMETHEWFAIHDIQPNASTHVLIIPKKHGSIQQYASKEDSQLLGTLMIATNEVAKKLCLENTGYRLIINYGEDSQAHILDHLHIHLLGGQRLDSNLINKEKK